jgi:hypothetical protein
MRDYFRQLIAALSETLGTRIEMQGDSVLYDFDDFPVLIEYLDGSEQVVLAVSVCSLPAKGREKLYLALLQGQYLFQRTGGATLAVDAEEAFVALQVVKNIHDLTAQSFPTLLENFLHVAAYWRDECERIGGETQVRQSDPGNPAGMMWA